MKSIRNPKQLVLGAGCMALAAFTLTNTAQASCVPEPYIGSIRQLLSAWLFEARRSTF